MTAVPVSPNLSQMSPEQLSENKQSKAKDKMFNVKKYIIRVKKEQKEGVSNL